MLLKRTAVLIGCMAAAMSLSADELQPEQSAKFLKVIMASAGQSKVACADPAVKAALVAMGVAVDAGASVIWCTNISEAKGAKSGGRLVVVGRRDLAQAAAIIVEEEGGRPKLVFNNANMGTWKNRLGDALMKIGN